MTQKQFAQICGVSLSTIKRGEASGRWGNRTIEKVARNLSIAMGRLITPDDLILKPKSNLIIYRRVQTTESGSQSEPGT